MTTPSEKQTGTKVSNLMALRQALMEGGMEVIGPQEADRLFARLNAAPIGDLSALHLLLQEDYGQRGGQGLALRLGRASFQYAIRRWGEGAGLTGSAFRLQPSPRRIRTALDALANYLSEQLDSRITRTEDPTCWMWRVERCPACRERTASGPDCHLLAGVLQETLTWAGGGRIYRVRELECCAAGAPACLFQIEKKPLD
jgi:hypothetical protein